MSDADQLAATLMELTARSLAIRDVVARLLAYHALRSTDPTAKLKDISEMNELRLSRYRPTTEFELALDEKIRSETDTIIALARVAITGGK